MQKQNIGDLRGHLFDAIEQLKSGRMDVKTAQAVAQLGDVVVQSAKVEVDFLKLSGQARSEFLLLEDGGSGGTTPSNEPRPALAIGEHTTIRDRYGKVGDRYYSAVVTDRGERKLVEVSWRSLKETLGGLECVPVYADRAELESALIPV